VHWTQITTSAAQYRLQTYFHKFQRFANNGMWPTGSIYEARKNVLTQNNIHMYSPRHSQIMITYLHKDYLVTYKHRQTITRL